MALYIFMFTIFRFFRVMYLNRWIHFTYLLDCYRQWLWVIMGTPKAFITFDSQKQKRTGAFKQLTHRYSSAFKEILKYMDPGLENNGKMFVSPCSSSSSNIDLEGWKITWDLFLPSGAMKLTTEAAKSKILCVFNWQTIGDDYLCQKNSSPAITLFTVSVLPVPSEESGSNLKSRNKTCDYRHNLCILLVELPFFVTERPFQKQTNKMAMGQTHQHSNRQKMYIYIYESSPWDVHSHDKSTELLHIYLPEWLIFHDYIFQ